MLSHQQLCGDWRLPDVCAGAGLQLSDGMLGPLPGDGRGLVERAGVEPDSRAHTVAKSDSVDDTNDATFPAALVVAIVPSIGVAEHDAVAGTFRCSHCATVCYTELHAFYFADELAHEWPDAPSNPSTDRTSVKRTDVVADSLELLLPCFLGDQHQLGDAELRALWVLRMHGGPHHDIWLPRRRIGHHLRGRHVC